MEWVTAASGSPCQFDDQSKSLSRSRTLLFQLTIEIALKQDAKQEEAKS